MSHQQHNIHQLQQQPFRQPPPPYVVPMNNGMLHQPPVVYGNAYCLPPPPPTSTAHASAPPQYMYNSPVSQQPINYFSPTMDLTKGSPTSSNGEGSPRTPPTHAAVPHNTSSHLMHLSQESSMMVTPLMPPPAHAFEQNQSTEERVRETIARANTVPMEFYQTEFFEYNSQQKRKRAVTDQFDQQVKSLNLVPQQQPNESSQMSTSELRRQVHIQSEQKRRAQIKDGFEELRQHLPGCSNKKLSKAALLTRTVKQLQHMKKTQDELLAEVERLAEENSNLKNRFTSLQTTTTATI